jgi:hypothetical protein
VAIIVRHQKIELQLSKHAVLKTFLTPQESEEIAGTLIASEDLIILEADGGADGFGVDADDLAELTDNH